MVTIDMYLLKQAVVFATKFTLIYTLLCYCILRLAGYNVILW